MSPQYLIVEDIKMILLTFNKEEAKEVYKYLDILLKTFKEVLKNKDLQPYIEESIGEA